jgi:hypothetical protein
MKIFNNNKKYFKLNCRYLTHDGKYFRETIITIKILEFQDVIKIILLKIYPLEYYVEK